MWSLTNTLLRKYQCHRGLAEQSMKTTFHTSKATRCAFFILWHEPKTHTTGLTEKHWYGILKCLQLCNMGTKCTLWMCTIMNEVNHSLPISCFMNLFCFLWGRLINHLHYWKCRNHTVWLQRVLWVMNISCYIYFYCTFMHSLCLVGRYPVNTIFSAKATGRYL